MRPELVLLLLSLSSSLLLLPAASVCVPRNASLPAKPLHSIPTPSPSPSPSPPLPPPPPQQPLQEFRLSSTDDDSESDGDNTPAAALLSSDVAASTLGSTLEDFCSKTTGPDVCLSSIKSLGSIAAAAPTLASVLDLQMRAAHAKVQEVLDIASKLMKDPTLTKQMLNNLQACTEGYEDALDSIESGRSAAAARDGGTFNSMLSAADEGLEQCDDEFMGSETNPMHPYKQLPQQMVRNALVLGHIAYPIGF